MIYFRRYCKIYREIVHIFSVASVALHFLFISCEFLNPNKWHNVSIATIHHFQSNKKSTFHCMSIFYCFTLNHFIGNKFSFLYSEKYIQRDEQKTQAEYIIHLSIGWILPFLHSNQFSSKYLTRSDNWFWIFRMIRF